VAVDPHAQTQLVTPEPAGQTVGSLPPGAAPIALPRARAEPPPATRPWMLGGALLAGLATAFVAAYLLRG
jgi:hypothetical protein